MNNEKQLRKIVLYGNYFDDFFNGLDKKSRDKVLWVLKLIEDLPVIPKIYFKHLKTSQGIYEVRISYAGNIFRVFCFFNKDKEIVLLNAFRKTTNKTPLLELEKAIKLRKEYEKQ
jgi:phage-related protein